MKTPNHIAFIMDGNGRWAKSKGKPRTFGHTKGANNIYSVVKACFDRGIGVVSLYAFSTENFSRPKEEVDKIFSLLKSFLQKYSKTLVKNRTKLIVSGDITRLPKGLSDKIVEVEGKTSQFTDNILNIAINYGARAEIVRAVNEIIKSGASCVTEEEFKDFLYTKSLPDVDLVVRTSGEQRLSNFLLYQSAYAELYFTQTLWPDFDEKELENALEWFDARDRRYGKV